MIQRISGAAGIDSAILSVAAQQHGVVARSQLLERGVTKHAIDYRLECGALASVFRGVYSVAAPRGRLARQFSAVLAAGDESFVSHRAAAAVYEILPPLGNAAAVEVSTRRDVRIGAPGIRVYRVSRLEIDEVMTRDGLPMTTPARTLIDLAGGCDSRELERALGSALRLRLVDRKRLEALLDRYAGRPGGGRLRALLATEVQPAFTRSEAERRFLILIRTSGLPRPETNVVVEGFEVDFLWREERLIVEVDGLEYHSGDHAFERDRDRDGILVAAGFRTMRVTWRQIGRRPERLLVRLAQALIR